MSSKCRKCNQSIKPAMIAVKVAGKEYHPACVSCCRCDKGLWGKDYIRTHEGKLQCERPCTPSNRPESSRAGSATQANNSNSNNSNSNNEPKYDYVYDDEVKFNRGGINKKGNNGKSRYAATGPPIDYPPKNNSPRNNQNNQNTPRIRVATATINKFCNKCKQSVMHKKYITFEDGEVNCQNCNVLTALTPRPKSSHMILCSICNKTVKGMRYFTEPDDTIVCKMCDVRAARCFKCKNLFKFNDTPCIVQNPSIPGTGIQLHKSCFNCSNCSQPLEINNYFPSPLSHDLPICSDCYSVTQIQERQPSRSDSISNSGQINNNNKDNSTNKAPENSALCIKCAGPILGPCLIVENQPIHHDCFTCNNCKAFLNTETGFYKDENGQTVCEDCNLAQSSLLKCGKCRNPIMEMNGIQYMQKTYHPECYSCVQCSVNLSTMKRTMTHKENGQLYCEGCFIKFLAPRCYKCQDSIYAPHKPGFKHEDHDYHLRCFACSKCKKSLADKKFFKTGNQLRCETCF